METCSISTDSLFDLLQSNDMKLPPPNGTIVDMGNKGNLRIFLYKFHKDYVTQCSKATSVDFSHVMHINDKEQVFNPPTKLGRNLSWSFFVLTQTQN